jgi:hypothetical protein
MICAIIGVILAVAFQFGAVWLWNELDGISWDYTEDEDGIGGRGRH